MSIYKRNGNKLKLLIYRFLEVFYDKYFATQLNPSQNQRDQSTASEVTDSNKFNTCKKNKYDWIPSIDVKRFFYVCDSF